MRAIDKSKETNKIERNSSSYSLKEVDKICGSVFLDSFHEL